MKPSLKTDLLYNELMKKIVNMHNGEIFPTVRQLMQDYSVSQATVSAVIQRLQGQRLLKSRVGSGTVVSKPEITKPRLLLLQPTWDSAVFHIAREAIAASARANNFDFSLKVYDYHLDITKELHNFVAEIIIIDGISNDHLTPEQAVRISQCPFPVILHRNTVPLKNINYYCGDNVASGLLLVNYLQNLGHKKLGFLICEPHLYAVEDLTRGVNTACQQGSIALTVLDCQMQPGDQPDAAIKVFATAIATKKYDFTALIACSRHGGLLLKDELLQLKIKIPDELSIITNNITPDDDFLTGVGNSTEINGDVVKLAREILYNRNSGTNQVLCPPFLVEKKSVKSLKIKKMSVKKAQLV